MRRIFTVGTVGIVFCVVLVGLIWVLRPSPPRALELASYSGRTNGMVGAIAPTFGTLSSNYAATIDRWLDAGTNAALFTLTNQQVCAIWVSPFVTICTAATQSSREMMPLLNAPDFSGIKLAPGQVATVQVALVPSEAPWRAEFYYTRDSCSDSLQNRLKLIPEELRALTTRTPVRVESHIIQSDVINK
jgi:hypothetical protein